MLVNARLEAIVPVSNLGRAIEFYEGRLGLELAERVDELAEHPEAWFYFGDALLVLYESVGAGQSRHTLAAFLVDDIDAVVEGLRRNGVVFEEYDLSELRTVNGIAQIGEFRGAFFRDPDGNILGVGQHPRVRAAPRAS